MNEHIEGLHAELDNDPQDQRLRAILADAYEDAGDHDEAEFLRLMVREVVEPYQSQPHNGNRWFIWTGSFLPPGHTSIDRKAVIRRLHGDRNRESFYYPSRQDAERDVHRVLQTLGYPTIRQPQEIAPCTPTH